VKYEVVLLLSFFLSFINPSFLSYFLYFLLLLLIWRLSPSGLFPFRINLKLWILQSVGRIPWAGDQPFARPLLTQDNTDRINSYRHLCLKWDSNPRSQVFEKAKIFCAFDARPHFSFFLFSFFLLSSFFPCLTCSEIIAWYTPQFGCKVGLICCIQVEIFSNWFASDSMYADQSL
jgi:hypothetical protein